MALLSIMRISTGIEGLDHILRGGMPAGRVYLVHGEPGTGKTTLGLHFLCAGESGLLITFAQSEEQIRADARALNLNLERLKILDLTAPPEVFAEVQTYDIFSPAEVEREPVSQQISKAITEFQPQRIFLDNFSHFRNLASGSFQFHRLAQSFFRFATKNGATLVISAGDGQSACMVDGVIELQFLQDERRIRVTKLRSSDFYAGSHPMRLTGDGLQVSAA